MRTTRSFLLIVLLCGTLLAALVGCGCAVSRPTSHDLALSSRWPASSDSAASRKFDSVATAQDDPRSKRPGWLSPFRRRAAPEQTPIVVPMGAQLQLPKKLRNSSLVLQFGNGNDARTKTETRTKTSEKSKLSGGSSSASESGTAVSSRKSNGVATGAGAVASPVIEQSSSFPWWLLVGALLVGLAGGTWIGTRFSSALRWLPFLSLLLVGAPVHAQKQLHISRTRYSYTESRITARRAEQARKASRKAIRKELRQLQREHAAQQAVLKKNRRKHPAASLRYYPAKG